ncbi:MAG: hypothetical protein L3J82_03095 [Planctomycetes bacterium]|nr:hypothetical protein [Planctomycetota bacterium]
MSLADIAEQINMLDQDELRQVIELATARMEPEHVHLEEWEKEMLEEAIKQCEAEGFKGRPWEEVKAEILASKIRK